MIMSWNFFRVQLVCISCFHLIYPSMTKLNLYERILLFCLGSSVILNVSFSYKAALEMYKVHLFCLHVLLLEFHMKENEMWVLLILLLLYCPFANRFV